MNSQVSFVRDYDTDGDCVIVAEFDAPSDNEAGVTTIYGRIVPDENFSPKEENSAEDGSAHFDSFAFLEMAIYDDASTPVALYSEDDGSINLCDAVTAYIIPPPQGFEDNLLDSLQRPASPPFIGFESSECFIHKIKDEKFSTADLSRFGDGNIIVEDESNNVYVQESWQPVVWPGLVERERMTAAKYHRLERNGSKKSPSRSFRNIDAGKPRKESARAKKSSKILEIAADCSSGPESSVVDRIAQLMVSVPARKQTGKILKSVEISDKDNCTVEAADIGVFHPDTRDKELHVVLHRCDIQSASVFSLAHSVDENAALNERRVSLDNSTCSSGHVLDEANFSSVAACSNAKEKRKIVILIPRFQRVIPHFPKSVPASLNGPGGRFAYSILFNA
ncbi:hypothetical protein QAD02_011500 [Eretmocerus hayati]|uniref:Uncharacterized protein n=1 Tax=Eretmocerus hayati TaxID=131215 RepID=A0ACC2NWR3_9HYME|nr:hypothetical protein QAD02_011500 [Eretmocerus hayati]